MRRFNSRSTNAYGLALAAGLAPVFLTPAALAQTLSWFNAAGGSASTPANWNPATIPGAANDLLWNLNNTYTVTFDASTAASRTHVYRRGVVTLVASSPHTTTNGFTIASVSGDVATVTLTTGTWSSAFSSAVGFDIGDVAGATGTLNVNDDDADLLLTGSLARVRVGVGGTGTLNITNVGRVEIGNGIIVGSNGGSGGTLLVSGGLASPPFGRSTLVTTNAAGLSHFGSSGACTATISNGGLADIASDLFIGQAVASVATTTVGGFGGLFRATLDVAGDVYVGANDSATSGGAGTLTANSGGDVLIGGTLHVGDDPNGGTGTLNINTGSVVQAAGVVDGSNGTINHTGGTLRINGGAYSGMPIPLSVSGLAANDVTLTFANNAAQTLAPSGGISLIVGDDLGAGTFEGFLNVESGADLDMGNGDLNIGDDAGTTGTVTIDGAGSRLIANSANSDVRVGFNGTGELFLSNGGQLLSRNLLVPALNNAAGFLHSTGSGTSITTQFLAVGHSSGTGSGFVVVETGSSLTVTDPGFSTNIRATGGMSVGANGTFSTPGTITVEAGGTLGMAPDSQIVSAALVDVDGGRLMSSGVGPPGLIDAPVRVHTGGLLQVLDSDLTVGDAASAAGVILDSGSITRVGADRTLTLRDDGIVDANGAIDMQGGSLVLGGSNTALLMLGGSQNQLGGFGTIDASILTNPSGVCTPTGTGLVFLKRVMLNGPFHAQGTIIRFGSASVVQDLSGTHLLDCRVIADAGSVIGTSNTEAFGPATLGDGGSAGVVLNGVVHLGTNGQLTLNDSNGVALGTLTDMNGGNLTSSNGLVVNAGRVLRGRGSINVPAGALVLSGGTIDPDAYFSDTDTYHGVASFSVSGAYTQQGAASYLCEIAGYNNEFQPQNDRLNVSGVATLNGTLNVSLIDGYAPTSGDQFTILTASSVVGTFSTENIPANSRVVYHPNRVEVVFEICDPDVNCDGAINGFDVEATEQAVNGDFSNFCLPSADLNGDGAENGFDIETEEQRVNGAPC